MRPTSPTAVAVARRLLARSDALPRTASAGLTRSEAAVLDALVGLRRASVPPLSARTGVLPDALARALTRPMALEYALEVGDGDEGTEYRPMARGTDA